MLAAVEPDLGVADVDGVLVVAVAWRHDHGPMAPHGELVAVTARHHGQAPGLGPGVHFRTHDHHGRVQMLRRVLGPLVQLLRL